MTRILLLLLLISGSACTRDFQPGPELSGEQIFQSACQGCHQPNESGAIYRLAGEKATVAYIRQKVKSGSWVMPKFPNMSDAAVSKVCDYALQHNQLSPTEHPQ